MTEPDHLRRWWEVRRGMLWDRADRDRVTDVVPAPVRDGVVHGIETVDRARDPVRADRLRAALRLVRDDVHRAAGLDATLLTRWQRAVLADPHVALRQGTAYAKGGTERYGPPPDIHRVLDTVLAEATDERLALHARVARVYLDVCFVHPFPDGNGRSAYLTAVFVLERAGVVLDETGPLRRVRRHADDPADATALSTTVRTLITGTHRRARHHEYHHR